MNNLAHTRTLFWLTIGLITILITFYFKTEYDVYWHIKVGEWIVNNLKIPSTGIFSHTKADKPWTPHEWLSEVIIYLIFNILGWPGLVMMGMIALTLSILIMLRYLIAKLPTIRALYLTLMGYGLLMPHIMPRPHILALPIMTFWFVQLLKASEQHQAPSRYLILMLILWANIHGSFLIGIVYALFFAIEAITTAPQTVDRIQLTKQWTCFLLICLACLAATPLGIRGILLPFQLTGQNYLTSHIGEWLSPNFQSFQFLELWIIAVIIFGFTQKMELPLLRLIFLIGLIHLSLKHQRYGSDLMSLQAPLLLAAPLAKHWRIPSQSHKFTLTSLLPITRYGKMLLISALMSWSIYIFAYKDIEYPLSKNINSILTTIRQENLPGKVYNSYALGGYLIFQGFNTFIDSRGELYQDDFIESFMNANGLVGGEKKLNALFDQHPEVSWALLTAEEASIAYFNMNPDWTLVYSNNFAAIYARKNQWHQQSIDQLKLKLQQFDTKLNDEVSP